MNPEENISGICFSYSGLDAVLAQRLIFDLKAAGFHVWENVVDNSEQGDTVAELYRAIETCDVFLPICSVNYVNVLSWEELRQLVVSANIHTIPLLVQMWDVVDWVSEAQSIDFSSWRNTIDYRNSVEKLTTIIKVRFPKLSVTSTDNETQYINRTFADIEYYKSLINRGGNNSETLPTGASAIYSNSMWGMLGEFEVIDEDDVDTQTESFYKILEDYPRFILLGNAGVGKTTTLYRTTLDVLRAYKADSENFPLPYLLHLGRWNDDVSFETFLQSYWPFVDDPSEILPQGKVFILLDGLDEVGHPHDNKLQSLYTWLHGNNAPKFVIITCDLAEKHLAEELDLPEVKLGDLDAAAMRQYVLNHLDNANSQILLSQIASDLVNDDSEISELAINLQNLAIMVSLIQVEEEIPNHQAQLLYWKIRALWAKEKQNPQFISFDEGFQKLSYLAFSMIYDDTSAFVSYKYALEKVGNSEILQLAINAGLLWMRGKDIGFRHLLFRDCCATYHLVIDEGIYAHLSRPRISDDGYISEQKWDKIILMACSLVDDPAKLILDVAEINPILALECMTYSLDINQKTQEIVIEKLLTLLTEITQPIEFFELLPNQSTLFMLLEYIANQPRSRNEGLIMPLKKLGADAVRFLTDVLRGDQWQRRKGAAWMLGEMNVHDAIPGLIEALADENESVRKEADYALARIGKPALPHLLKALQSDDTDLKAGIIKVLGRIGSPSTVSDLVACLSDMSWPHREEVRICDLASVALEYIGTEDALGAVASWKEQIRNAEASSQLHTKVKTGQTKALSVEKPRKQLIEELKDNDWSVRRAAVQSLGEAGSKASLPHILNALTDEDSHVRWMAVKTLSNFKGKQVLKGLISALHDDDYLICDAAADVLREIGIEAAPALIEALSSNNVNVRGNAAEVLGQIQSQSAIPHLVDMLEDVSTPRWEGVRICDIAATALEAIGTEQALLALNRWREEQQTTSVSIIEQNTVPLLHLDNMNQNVSVGNGNADSHKMLLELLDDLEDSNWNNRQEATNALRNYAKEIKDIHSVDIASGFALALKSDNSIVRWSATEALVDFGDDAIPYLLDILHDENWTIRLAAIHSLLKLETDAAVPGLLKLINDNNTMVRETAISALGKLGNPSVCSYLINLLNDEDMFIRRVVVESLGQLKCDKAVNRLIAMLEYETNHVKLTVIEALGRIGNSDAIPVLVKYLKDESQPDWENQRVCDIAANSLKQFNEPKAQTALEKWRVGQLR